MDETVRCLTTPEECEQYIKNVQERYPAKAIEARRKLVELRATSHGAQNAAERESLRAVYAYEEALSAKNGRKTRASRTWQMIKRHGIIGAVERAVNRKDATVGYTTLIEMGMQDFAFEAVILRHPDSFSTVTVERAKARMDELEHSKRFQAEPGDHIVHLAEECWDLTDEEMEEEVD
jgi:hypothetical protein